MTVAATAAAAHSNTRYLSFRNNVSAVSSLAARDLSKAFGARVPR
jgi:hypothetical protein